MTEQTETERNEAKAKYLFENCWYWVKPDEANYIKSMVDSLSIIISAQDMKRIIQDRTTALESQSEAERKIEKAIAECKKAISDIGHTRPYVAACEDILQILEGAADV